MTEQAATGYRDARIIGRVLKKAREAIQVKTVTIDRPGAEPFPVAVVHVACLRSGGVWRHRADRHGLAGITIRADLLGEVIELLQQAKAEIDGR